MRVIDPGHEYELMTLDGPLHNRGAELLFVKREGEMYPGNVGAHPGTTTQEVLRALIDRTKYVDNQIHDVRNAAILLCLRRAIYELEARAAVRHGRAIPATYPGDIDSIETLPTCKKCGHIGCEGTCHS